jgi:hypothetical protein
MATVKDIFDMAIHLMDEQDETDGKTLTEDTEEYRFRTVSILNTALPQLALYDNGEDTDNVGMPILYYTDPQKDSYMEQGIPLSDRISCALLPLYLAAQLLSGENEALASWFMNQYQGALAEVKRQNKASFQPISTPYGLF